jgi:hypothetical protein
MLILVEWCRLESESFYPKPDKWLQEFCGLGINKIFANLDGGGAFSDDDGLHVKTFFPVYPSCDVPFSSFPAKFFKSTPMYVLQK